MCLFRRIRDKYEAEFRELEHSERQTKERFNQMKGEMTEVEGKFAFFFVFIRLKINLGENERLQVIIKQKETEINDIKRVKTLFNSYFFYLNRVIRLLIHYKKNENVYRI